MKAFFQAILLALLAAGVGLAYNQFISVPTLSMPWDATTASTEKSGSDADDDAADASDPDGGDTDAGKTESEGDDADAKAGANAPDSSEKSKTTAAKSAPAKSSTDSSEEKKNDSKASSDSFDPSGIVTTKPGGKTPSLRSGLSASSSKETKKPSSDTSAKASSDKPAKAKGDKPAKAKDDKPAKAKDDKPKASAGTQTPAKKDKPETAKPAAKPAPAKPAPGKPAAAKDGKDYVTADQGHESGRIAKENDIKCLSYAGMKKRVADKDAWTIIDARSADDYSEGRIPNAKNITYRKANKKAMLNRLADYGINAGTPIVIYCSSQTCEKAAEMAAWLLVEEQFIDVSVYIEGYDIWKARKEAE